ncbi:CPCC family cysteine-rich protein [Actinospica robiniae]|uniref:CPCC family cysteine-rich protein n=1 Tax=Actinospica robiniae TaxID=304901 RepID=UPI000A02A2B5
MEGNLYQCTCCHPFTLDSRACFDICDECGWEDDGQDDPYADEVRGGPDDRLSLTRARERYARRRAAEPQDVDSVVHGGEGRRGAGCAHPARPGRPDLSGRLLVGAGLAAVLFETAPVTAVLPPPAALAFVLAVSLRRRHAATRRGSRSRRS